MSIDSGLGKRIEKAIKDSPYSAKEVAGKIEISPQAISKSIRNSSMGKNNLRKLAKITEVDEEWLIQGKVIPSEEFDAELMSRCIIAVKKAASDIGMHGLDEAKVTHAALILYKANQ